MSKKNNGNLGGGTLEQIMGPQCPRFLKPMEMELRPSV
jgi:hypothetical protein